MLCNLCMCDPVFGALKRALTQVKVVKNRMTQGTWVANSDICLSVCVLLCVWIYCIHTSFCATPRDAMSNDDYSSDDGSDDSTGNTGVGEISMTLNHLQSLHQLDCQGDTSSFAEHGMNLKRLKELSKQPPCECGCRVPFKVLKDICQTFWSLPKESQDAFLWTIQSSTGRRKNTWSIQGLTSEKTHAKKIGNSNQEQQITVRIQCMPIQLVEVHGDWQRTNSAYTKEISRD